MDTATINTIVTIAALWELPWKGVAMWRAARNRHLVWFLVFLLVHVAAIPEILYLAFFQKKTVKTAEKKAGKKK